MSLIFPVDAKLKDGSPVQLVLADNQDIEPLRRLYRVMVEEGTMYPHDRFPDEMASWTIGFAARARWRLMCRTVPMRWAWPGRSAARFMHEMPAPGRASCAIRHEIHSRARSG